MAKKQDEKKYRVNAKAGLLTYNELSIDPWFNIADIKDELKAKFTADINFSVCLEEESRKHVHVFFEADRPVDCDLQYFATTRSGPVGDFQPNRGKNLTRGHYYCQCIYKKSHLECVFDKPVKAIAKWLVDMWRDDKIEKIKEALAAEKLLTPQLLQQVDAVSNYNQKEKVRKMLKMRDERVNKKLKKFEKIKSVEEWKKTFVEELLRYKFLVLCGKSKLRKTEYAKSLFGNPFMHKDKVDWDGYDWLFHGCIIFDDINQPDHIWKYVRQNKVLFQSSSIVAVNTSATNCYKRDVCVVQKPIIICTNDGLLEPFVSGPYREWIEANSVWVDISEPIPFEYNKSVKDIPALTQWMIGEYLENVDRNVFFKMIQTPDVDSPQAC